MNSTTDLTLTFDYPLEKSTLLEEIDVWMDSNTFDIDQSYVWEVGVCTESILKSIQSRVLRDIECKHFRCWGGHSFKRVIGILSHLNKRRLVFKSELNDYTDKGHHLFMYKTSCTTKILFYHTLHH